MVARRSVPDPAPAEPALPDLAFPNPLDWVSGPSTQWTRVNVAEAWPGVVTPLHYDFALRGGELGIRGSYFERGVITEEEAAEQDVADDRVMAAFRGRVAVNVDAMRRFADRVSPTAADEVELALLGSVRPDAPSNPTTDRHEIIAERDAEIRADIERRALALAEHVAELWRRLTAPDVAGDVDGARARWQTASDEFRDGAVVMTHVTTFAGEAFGAVMMACIEIGRPELLSSIHGGYGDTHDDEMSSAMWELAHGRLGWDDFLAEYGYQGHGAADLSATVWREDPDLLRPTLDALARLPDDAAPRLAAAGRGGQRVEAERELLDVLASERRSDVEHAIEQLRRFTALREEVKAVSQRSLDIARSVARTLGRALVAEARLDDPDDVLFLVADEFVTGDAPDLRERAAYRRRLVRGYEEVDLPLLFVGNPEPVPAPAGGAGTGTDGEAADRSPAPAGTGAALTGLGVSPGVVEGQCRVIVDPATAEPLEAGEILVCRTTDPSWVGHFLVASVLVIDVGGPMSHGAIVARELGVPCVIGTGTGTAQLRTGDVVRVDGTAGTVERILAV